MHKPTCVVSKDSADTFRLLRSRETKQSLQATAKTKWSHVTDPVLYLIKFIIYKNLILFFRNWEGVLVLPFFTLMRYFCVVFSPVLRGKCIFFWVKVRLIKFIVS
ncbi:hypothetical protein Clo1100_2846 [Clostridium sp. BNL1100]|nr:hypothetical protein Clo1100_2846 [Clostridium sp. BNL1100]